MSIYAIPYSGGTLKSLMQRVSTNVHKQIQDILSLWIVMSQIADVDLKAMIADGEGLTSPGDDTEIDVLFGQVRDWQYAVKNIADNYTADGTLADGSFQVAKRAVL